MKVKQGFFVVLVLGFGLFFVALVCDSKRVLSTADAVWSKISPSLAPSPTPTPPIKNETPAPSPPAPMSGEALYDQQYNAKGASEWDK